MTRHRSLPPRLVRAAGAIALAVGVTAAASSCAGDGGDAVPVDTSVVDRASTSADVTTTVLSTGAAPSSSSGAPVPDTLRFQAPLVGGGSFDGASVSGTPTVFWFWAPT